MADLNSGRFQTQDMNAQRKVRLLVFLFLVIAMIVTAFYAFFTTSSVYLIIVFVILVFLTPLVNALVARATKRLSADG